MASEREVTQFEKVRVAAARRPMHLLTAKLEQWGRQVAPGFINEAWKLVGTLRDAIRVGQYDLGIPFMYQKTAELLPETSVPLIINVKKFGVISHMMPLVTNITPGAGDFRLNAGITRIQIGGQTIFEAQDGTLFRPTEVFTTGFTPVAGGFGSPADQQGYLRRIPVAQGDVIEVQLRNFSTTDSMQIGLMVTQYGMIPPQALEDD
jgi:hypothetical protein